MLTRESRAATTATADVRGTVIATAGLLALLYPLIEGRRLDWPLWSITLMAVCPLLLWLFIRYERALAARGQTPLVAPALLRHRGALGGLLVSVLFFAGTAYTLVLTVHLQTGAGYTLTAASTGLTGAPSAAFSPGRSGRSNDLLAIREPA